jgi:hypothetical protein
MTHHDAISVSKIGDGTAIEKWIRLPATVIVRSVGHGTGRETASSP